LVRYLMDALRPGDPGSVGSYRLLGRLGTGGMGQVFAGVSPGGRQVAVKVIHPAHAGTSQFRERFALEVEAARKVGGFHTAQVVDADPQADPPWMVTAYVAGPSLQDAVERDGPLPPARVRALGAGLAEGLAAIHAHGLVHRDLKPGNVILAADGPRIIDFGIARTVDATAGITTAGAVMGTAAYLSPEQVHGNPAGPASDVFALGCVLAYAATGRPPFVGDSVMATMFRIATEPPDLAGLDDAGLAALINGCLAKAAADRPEVPAILTALSRAGSAPVAARAAAAAVPAAVDHGALTQTSASVRGSGGSGRQVLGSPGLVPPPGQVPPGQVPPVGGTRGWRSGRRVAVLIGVIAVAAVALAVVLSVSLSAGSKPQATPSHRPLAAGPAVSSAGTTPGQSRPTASAPSSTAAKHGRTPAKRGTLTAPAVSQVKVTGRGLTLAVTAVVKDAGKAATCAVSVSGGKIASGACGQVITVGVPMYNTAYDVTYTARNAAGVARGSASGTSGLKSLTANATDAYGACPGTGKYCGGNSNMEPTPYFVPTNGAPTVPEGTTETAGCWLTGGVVHGTVVPYKGGSTLWVRIPGQGYMSILWFPNPDSVTSGLPSC
jgi:hypothetical protein